MTKTYEQWKPDSDIINEWIVSEKHTFTDHFKWQMIDSEDDTVLKECRVKDILDDLQVTMTESIEIGDNVDFPVDYNAWVMVGPHSDRDDEYQNATGFNGNPYAGFLFLHTDGHVLQYDFEKNTASWDNNRPAISRKLQDGDMVILNIQETHALGLENDEHLDWMKAQNTSEICDILKKNSDRMLIALMIGYQNKPTKEQVLHDMEKVVSYQLDMKNQNRLKI